MSATIIDRALLKLAAKAGGLRLSVWFGNELREGFLCANSGSLDPVWNALDDDGDALRLAVKLRLTVSWDRFDDDDYATATPPHTHQGYDCMVDQDPHASTRRAIVRAAAEIGRAMP